MKPMAIKLYILIQCAILTTVFSAKASTISLEPSTIQRAPGSLVRVNIFADNAADLVSMGVKVSFNPAVVQAETAAKYEDVAGGWLMDEDGNPSTTGDQFANPSVETDNVAGTVIMTGAHLAGPATTGLSGKVLLGWVDFRAVGSGSAALNVDLARKHPSDPVNKFDNFVTVQGSISEPTNIPADIGGIYIGSDACEGDINGDGITNVLDLIEMQISWLTDCTSLPPGSSCSSDLNGDGIVNTPDLIILKLDWLRQDCPVI